MIQILGLILPYAKCVLTSIFQGSAHGRGNGHWQLWGHILIACYSREKYLLYFQVLVKKKNKSPGDVCLTWHISFAIPEPICVATEMGSSHWLAWLPYSFLWPNKYVVVIGSPSGIIWDKRSSPNTVNLVHHWRKEEREWGRQKQISSIIPYQTKFPPAMECLVP